MKGISYFILSTAALLFTFVSIASCNKDKTSIPVPEDPRQCPDTISFSGIIEPMIQQNCSTSGCHDATSAASGYDLEGYGNISTNANAILSVIRHESGVVAMPYAQPKLNDSIIDQFDCWMIKEN